jgi:KRI1-like family
MLEERLMEVLSSATFDPEEYEAAMAAAFGDDYYEVTSTSMVVKLVVHISLVACGAVWCCSMLLSALAVGLNRKWCSVVSNDLCSFTDATCWSRVEFT